MHSNSSMAVFTVMHDEDFWLPLWLKYYLEHLAPEDVYVVAHNCTELTEPILQEAEAKGVNVQRVYTDVIFDHAWLNQTVHAKQRALLENYAYVIFTDCDEFLVPTTGNLRDFIYERQPFSAIRAEGWNVLPETMFRDTMYDKTLITNFPLTYSYGYHTCDVNLPVTTELKLYHLHRISYEKSWERTQRLTQEAWDAQAVANNTSWENRIQDEDKFREWFFTTPSAEGWDLNLTNLVSWLGLHV